MELLLLLATTIPWADIATIATAVSVVLTAWLAQKARTRIADKQETKTNEIHVLVNSRLQQALDRISQLETELKKALNKETPTT